MLNITKLYDQPGWAYDFIAREMQVYSQCRIKSQAYNNINYDLQDIIIISGPNISYSETAIKIPNECKRKGIKVIGQYCGEVDMVYDHADLIITISPQLYLYAKAKYKAKNIPVIFLPESIDTNYFQPTPLEMRRFTPGWAGGAHKAIKRVRLFEQLKYPVKIMSEHGKEFFKVNRNQENMLQFYKDIDCFISMSETECLPRVVLEAMACGLPVVSTDVGGIHMLIPDEYIIPVNPEQACVEAMNNRLEILYNDFALRDGIGKINRAWCEKCWSWEANMPIWDEVFYYVHKGDTKKVLEIGESVIEPFKKYFEMNEQYEKQIARFSGTKIEHTPRLLPNPYDHTIVNLIEDLGKIGIHYWVSQESCLDTINHGRIVHKHDHIYLGTKCFADKNNLLNYLAKRGADIHDSVANIKGLNVHVIIENISTTKSMPLYGKDVNVPYPVVSYLMGKFGQDWSKS